LDKNKIIEAAAKLVAKGAYDKAIKEYQKVLDADPKDVRTLQKMGELYQKKNENAQAAVYFTRVAESYTADGFFLKAVALYKQVLKLDPSLVDINAKLAELHQQLQLIGEAMAYYQLVYNHWDKQGDTRRALDVLRKMVGLDPDNTSSREKLANLYVREGLNDEAAQEFSKVAEHLKRNNRTDDYLRVAERLSALQPDNLALAKELAEAYLAKNDQKHALAKLQICFKADNRDIDTLRLLAVAFQGMGQMSKTISVYKELAHAYADKNFHDDAEKTWRQVAQLDPNDADVISRRESMAASAPPPAAPPPPKPPPYAGVTAPAPAHYAAAPATLSPPPKPKPIAAPGGELAKLLTETDVYVKYGLHDKALEHLRKVFAIDPENIDAHEKAYAIYVASNNQQQSFEQLLNVLRLHTRSGDAQRAQPYLAAILQQDPGHAEVPVFLSALRIAGAGPMVQESADSDGSDDAILVDASDDEVIVADDGEDEVLSAEVEMADEPLDDMVLSPDDAQAAGEVEVDPPPVPDEDFGTQDSEVVSDEFEPSTGEFATDEDDAPTGALPIAVQSRGEPPPLGDDEHEAPTRAVPAYKPELGFEEDEPPTAAHAIPDEVIEEPAAEYQEEAVEAPPEEEPAGEECDEAMFFIEQGLFDEAREILETVLIAYPEHRRASELMAQVEASASGSTTPAPTPPDAAAPGGDEGRDAFDLAQELANELGDFGGEDAPAEEGGGDSGGSDEYQVSVDEVFAEFKKGLEKVVKPEDVDTHYDLGVAYKEMGLIDDAVGEFGIARKGCLGKRKEVDCLSMIGLLQVMRSDFPAAVEAFQLALGTEFAKGDVENSLRYDLGAAYEAAGALGKALGQFLKVQEVDGRFREVAGNVERLAAVATPEEEEAPPPKAATGAARGTRKNVGYV
jgi:pilus assembly protein FimV